MNTDSSFSIAPEQFYQKTCAIEEERKRHYFIFAATLLITILLSSIVSANGLDNKKKILFNIPQQRADQALIEFAEQADVTFIFSFDEAQKETANQLVGYFTQEKAITILLQGTGLNHELKANGTLAITQNNKQREDEMKKATFLNAVASVFIAVFGTSTATGQETENAEVGSESNTKSEETITIIGSHIKRIVDTEALPITTFSEEDINNLGVATGDELLRSIPQIGEVAFGASTGNGGVNDARGDVSSINLRGVGTGNTLTLLNGRRLVRVL